jgi:hypothetical protein
VPSSPKVVGGGFAFSACGFAAGLLRCGSSCAAIIHYLLVLA